MLTFEDVLKDEEIDYLIKTADRQLVELGYTEHGYRHIGIVSRLAGEIRVSRKNCRISKDSWIYA